MPLTISGKLSLPVTGQPAANAEVRFRAVTALGEIIPGAESTARCGADGTYNISIEFARYELSTKISTPDFIVHGEVTINQDTQATDLEDLITLIGITPAISDALIKQFQELTARAEKAAADSSSSAQDAAASAQTANDAKVAITPMYQYFNDHYPDFETNYQDFQTKYPDVVSKHDEVVVLAGETKTNAELAKKWADNPEDSAVEPGKYSALHWAEKAKYNANQTFISGGLFTPKAGTEYPDVSIIVRDTIWIIEFASHNDTYTFTGGQLSGETVKNGDLIFWDTPLNTWSIIPTSISGVLSVNGKQGPNVALTAADVSAPELDGDNNISVNTVKMTQNRYTKPVPSYATVPFRNNTTNDNELKFANLDTFKEWLNYTAADFDVSELKYSTFTRAEAHNAGLNIKRNDSANEVQINITNANHGARLAVRSDGKFRIEQADSSGANEQIWAEGTRAGSLALYYNNVKKFETTNSGTLTTGNHAVDGQGIFNKNGANVVLKGTETGNATTPSMQFQDGSNGVMGYIGYGSSGNQDLYTQNSVGNIRLQTNFLTYIDSPRTTSSQGQTVDSLTRKDYVDGILLQALQAIKANDTAAIDALIAQLGG